MEIAASVGPTLDATAGENTWRSSMGKKARPAVSTMPTSRAPTRAPRMEPMPPMTMHTSTRIRMSSPMPTCTEVMGPSSAPATAASMADRKSTRLNSSHLVISYAVFCLKKKNKITVTCVLDTLHDCICAHFTKSTARRCDNVPVSHVNLNNLEQPRILSAFHLRTANSEL